MAYDLNEDNFRPTRFLRYHIEDASSGLGHRTGGHGWKWIAWCLGGWALLFFGVMLWGR